jgi:hypothetical protein
VCEYVRGWVTVCFRERVRVCVCVCLCVSALVCLPFVAVSQFFARGRSNTATFDWLCCLASDYRLACCLSCWTESTWTILAGSHCW